MLWENGMVRKVYQCITLSIAKGMPKDEECIWQVNSCSPWPQSCCHLIFKDGYIRDMESFTDISILSFQTLFRAFLKFKLKNKMPEQRFSRYNDEQSEWRNLHLEMPSWSGDNSAPVCCLAASPASISCSVKSEWHQEKRANWSFDQDQIDRFHRVSRLYI